MPKALTAKALISLLSKKSIDDRNSVNIFVDVGGERYPVVGFALNENDGVLTTEANEDEDPVVVDDDEDDEKLFPNFEGHANE